MKIQLRSFSVLLALLALFGTQLHAQYVAGQQDPAVTKFPVQEIQFLGSISPVSGDDWDPSLKNIKKIHEPGIDIEKDRFLEIKEQANRAKAALNSQVPSKKTKLSGPPDVGTQYFGNQYNGGIPNDNDIAVSANGTVVSVTNTRIYMYSSAGILLQWSGLNTFSNGAPGVKGNTKFDPKISYDPNADRFVLVYLNGASPNSSQVIICFSQSNDPTGNWNIYAINGNVGGGVWSDFPVIGLSSEELFVTTNLFTSQGAATGAAVFQVELADGYNGNNLTSQIYQAPYFSLHPVEGGLTMYGPHFYLIRSLSQGSSRDISIHRISSSIANNGVLESPVTLQSDVTYSAPPNADQQGTNTNLMTGDCRMQNSYYENNRIQFVFNSSAASRPGIYLGTIVLSPFALSFSSCKGRLISFPAIEIAYPGIAYAGSQGIGGQNASFVSFNFCGQFSYAGNAAVYVDESEDISNYVILRNGSGPVGSGSQYRWGDYADIQEMPGTTGEAWVGASYAMTSGQTMTYISQIKTPLPLGSQTDPFIAPLADASLSVYPNPTSDNAIFDFDVEVSGDYSVSIVDMTGKTVRVLVDEYLRKGTGRAAFNTSPLENGTYIVLVTREGDRIFEEKLVVSH